MRESILGFALLVKVKAVVAAAKTFDRSHRWLCSAAAVLTLAALYEHVTPAALLDRLGARDKQLTDHLTGGWHLGLLVGAYVCAFAAVVGLLSVGYQNSASKRELLQRTDKYTLKDRGEDYKSFMERDLRNYGWVWISVLVLTQFGVLTPHRMFLFFLGIVLLRSGVESWLTTEVAFSGPWRDRRESFVANAMTAVAYGLLAAVALPARLFGVFSYPLSQRHKPGNVF